MRGRRRGGWRRSSVIGCRRMSRPPCTRRRVRAVTGTLDPIALAALIVSVAQFAWTVYADLRKRTAKPAPQVVARRVRVELAETDGDRPGGAGSGDRHRGRRDPATQPGVDVRRGGRDTARDTKPGPPVRLPVLLGPVVELVMLVEVLVDVVVHLCKAGVRGSIPLVSTSETGPAGRSAEPVVPHTCHMLTAALGGAGPGAGSPARPPETRERPEQHEHSEPAWHGSTSSQVTCLTDRRTRTLVQPCSGGRAGLTVVDTMGMAHDERAELVDLLVALTPEQWEAPTLCTRWRVRDVVAHVFSYDELQHGRTSSARFLRSGLNPRAGQRPRRRPPTPAGAPTS